jgi:hypothetical protein
MSIGIRLAGKNNRISATVFARSVNSFVELLKDVDSVVSGKKHGTVRWELTSLTRNSPAMIEFDGISRISGMDYVPAIQESLLDGLEQLTQRAEQPKFYSFSALQKVHQMAAQSKHLKWFAVFRDSKQTVVNERVSINVDYLVATGSKSLGSVRGSLDAIIVHSGHEFRVWSKKWARPITCKFDKAILQQVMAHLKQEVEVVGELHRNSKGEPVQMRVEQFIALEPAKMLPAVADIRGLIPDLYGGKTLQEYLSEMRDG